MEILSRYGLRFIIVLHSCAFLLFQMESISVSTPDQSRLLFKSACWLALIFNRFLLDINFEVKPGQSLLIVGTSGVGKSSLLRVLASLWPFDQGSLIRPLTIGKGGIFFVPQRPFITRGTLREQVIYPTAISEQLLNDDADRTITRILSSVGLLYLKTRWVC